MLDYMDYIEKRFYEITEWNEDNFYPHVNSSVENLIDFAIPRGTSLKISSQASTNSFASYTLSNRGLANGSVAYLSSSHPLLNIKTSDSVPLQEILSGYKLLNPLKTPGKVVSSQRWYQNFGMSRKETLYYGRIFFPGNDLEAMHIRRLSPTSQLVVKGVNDTSPSKGGVVTFSFQKDSGRFSQEYLYSTFESLAGVRSLYNFGFDQKLRDPTNPSRLSIGMEIYMALQTKSPGMSTALRYTTESAYTGSPLTLTILTNPLMGHVTATYSVRTTKASAFASRFDFNIYSYYSDLSLGCELLRNPAVDPNLAPAPAVSTVEEPSQEDIDMTKLTPNNPALLSPRYKRDEPARSNFFISALKASTSLGMKTLKILCEGRYKGFLISAGVGLNFAGEKPVATNIGLELQFSS